MAKSKKIRIHKLTDMGWSKLVEVCTSDDEKLCYDPDKDADILTDQNYSVPFEEAISELQIKKFTNQKEMAQNINDALGVQSFETIQNDLHLWGWLTFALWDQLQNDLKGKIPVVNKPYKIAKKKKSKTEVLELREEILFIPSKSVDFYKYQRHLVRTPCHLLHKFGENAIHLLTNKPKTRGEVLEQLTSRHPFWNNNFMKVGKKLYYDEQAGKLKDKTGGKGGGTPRALARIFRQFDVTWEMEQTAPSQFLKRLPAQFKEFL